MGMTRTPPYKVHTEAAHCLARRSRATWAAMTREERCWLRSTYRVVATKGHGVGDARMVVEFCLMFKEVVDRGRVDARTEGDG